MTAQPPASWHPDPYGRHDLRYWDGVRWTEHVSSRGLQGIDALVDSPSAPSLGPASKKVERQVRKSGAVDTDQVGGGTLFTERVLVVNQKTKLVGVNTEYVVYDQRGQRIGAVREVGQSRVKNAVSVLSAADRLRRLQVVDLNGRVLMALTRPAKLMKSTLIVRDVDGSEIGQIVQKNLGVFGKVRFALKSRGQTVGSISAENWAAWDFNIQDQTGREIARITKTWAGWAKERFTKSDNYVVEINLPLAEPLLSLVIATSLAIDTALKETNAGGSRYRIR